MDMKLELVSLPVTDVDRAKAFYVDQLGFSADHDHTISPELRFVQLTPPGSACSIAFGVGIDPRAPGSAQGLQVVIADAHAAKAELEAKGVEVGEVDVQPWGDFLHLTDPDGNGWSLQAMPAKA